MRKKSLLKGAVAFCLASSLLAQPALAADYTALRQANGGALAEQHRFLPTTEKAVILTFGGLSKEAPLQHILSYMQRENRRGTFFVTEREAARNGGNIALIIPEKLGKCMTHTVPVDELEHIIELGKETSV